MASTVNMVTGELADTVMGLRVVKAFRGAIKRTKTIPKSPRGAKVAPLDPAVLAQQRECEKDLEVLHKHSPRGESKLAYKIAIVLHMHGGKIQNIHRQVIRSLLAVGLKIGVLQTTEETDNYLIVVADAGDDDTTGSPRSDESSSPRLFTPREDAEGRPSTTPASSSAIEGRIQSHAIKKFQESVQNVMKGVIAHAYDEAKRDIVEKQFGLSTGKVKSQVPAIHRATTMMKRMGTRTFQMTTAEELVLLNKVVFKGLENINLDEGGNPRPFHDIVHDGHAGAPRTELERIVIDVFPLHDEVWNRDFKEQLMNEKARIGWGAWIVSAVWQTEEKYNVKRIQEHFGDRIGLYFSFLIYYSNWVTSLGVGCLLFYVAFRWTRWSFYVSGLGFIGVLIPSVWSPLFLRFWERKCHKISLKSRDHHYLPPPEMVSNPHLGGMKLGKIGERETRRQKLGILLILMVLANGIVLGLLSVFFIQWYVYGKLAPSCACCEYFDEIGVMNGTTTLNESWTPESLAATFGRWEKDCEPYAHVHARKNFRADMAPKSCAYFRTCFSSVGATLGTDRWVYILIQGIALGLTLDVFQKELFKALTKALTKFEYWETLSDYQTHLVRKQFFFTWLNMFIWFLMIAFIVVPFGSVFQDTLWNAGRVFRLLVPAYGWRDEIEIDAVFVTPMLVTAFLNLIIDTFVPILLARARIKARKARRAFSKMHMRAKKHVRHELSKRRMEVKRMASKGKQQAKRGVVKFGETVGKSMEGVKKETKRNVVAFSETVEGARKEASRNVVAMSGAVGKKVSRRVEGVVGSAAKGVLSVPKSLAAGDAAGRIVRAAGDGISLLHRSTADGVAGMLEGASAAAEMAAGASAPSSAKPAGRCPALSKARWAQRTKLCSPSEISSGKCLEISQKGRRWARLQRAVGQQIASRPSMMVAPTMSPVPMPPTMTLCMLTIQWWRKKTTAAALSSTGPWSLSES